MTYLHKHITLILFNPILQRTCVCYMATHSNNFNKSSTNCNVGKVTNTHKRSLTNLKSDEDSCKKIKGEISSNMILEDLISKHNFVVDETPVISESDNKEYLSITLSNGLRALLISDVKNLIDLEQLNEVTLGEMDEDAESDNDTCSENSINDDCVQKTEEDDDECKEGDDSKIDNEFKEKLAACALTVGVGSFSDPEEIPGLAHFLEHMIFMGSEKYPKENDFDSYISARGGSDNAETECEYTTFYFDCPEIHLEGGLERFSHFFITPLMNRSSITREREAVESEFKLNLTSDTSRCEQLFCSTAPLENPAHKFMWGNLITLQENVEEDTLYNELHKFWKRHYSAHRMTLAIQARLPLTTLADMVATHFGNIKNNNLPPDTFPNIDPPFKMDLFNKIYTIQPVKDINKVEITWALPSVVARYRTKPLTYLSHLIGHEGEGSLLALLQDKLWALAVISGIGSNGIDSNYLYTLFTIHIQLTDSGISNIENVLHLVFSYIKLLQTSGPMESIFREIQSVDEIHFRFKEEEEDAADYVETLSQAMQIYSSRNYIDGDQLMFEYNPEEIQQYLNLMTVDKANIMLLSKTASGKVELDKTEKWFSTKYNIKDIPEEWLSRLSNCERHPNLDLPKPNQYIATDFKIYPPPQEDIEFPRSILKTDLIETWYKQDTKFNLPIAVVRFYLISPAVLILPQNIVMTDMFVSLFHLLVARDLYPAKITGLDYSFEVGDSGLILTIYGYNDKLNLLFDSLLKELISFTSNVSEGLFEAVKEEIRKRYHNNLLKVSKLATDLRLSILCKPYWPSNVKLEVLPDITLKKLQEFSSQLLENLYVKCLIQGNITEDQALNISNKIIELIDYKPILEGCHPQILVRKLPEGEKVIRVQSFNTEDPTCNITNYYQCGLKTVEECCKIDLLTMLIQEPLFDTLRTQEQLGYDINCQTRITNGILGFSVTVKSQVDKHKVDYVEDRITKFLATVQTDIRDMSPIEFNQVKDSLKILKQQADNDLRSELKRNWVEIVTNEYMFDRTKTELKCIESFKGRDLALHLNKLITGSKTNKDKNICKSMKLSVQVDSEQNSDSFVENNQEKLSQENLSLQKSSSKLVIKVPEEKQVKFISDLEEFKNSLYIYPEQCGFKKHK